MKKPEYTLSYDRCVPVFRCFVAAFYSADVFILPSPFIPPLPLLHSYAYQIHFHHFIFGLNTRDAR